MSKRDGWGLKGQKGDNRKEEGKNEGATLRERRLTGVG